MSGCWEDRGLITPDNGLGVMIRQGAPSQIAAIRHALNNMQLPASHQREIKRRGSGTGGGGGGKGSRKGTSKGMGGKGV